MSYWRKKPVVIEAFKWTGGRDQVEDPDWIIDAIKNGTARIEPSGDTIKMLIFANRGVVNAKVGDYIIKGIDGELYPCKADIFECTYERVEKGDK